MGAFIDAGGLAAQASHMSCYSLIYETNTPMTARMHRGEFQKIDEELELQLFEHVYRRLRDAGYERYETSNYARAADAPLDCRHNLVYWKAGNWQGWVKRRHVLPIQIPEDERRFINGKTPEVWQNYLEAAPAARIRAFP